MSGYFANKEESRVLQLRTFALFGGNKLRFFWNLWCLLCPWARHLTGLPLPLSG